MNSTYTDAPTTLAEGCYIDHYMASNDNNTNHHPLLNSTYTDASTTLAEGCYIDHYMASNDDNTNHPLLNSTFTDTSTTVTEGCYVDHYMASDNDNSKLANVKAAEGDSSIKLPPEREFLSSDSSFTVACDSCPSPITGVYLPYVTAMEQHLTNNTLAYSTDNKALVATSTANQVKRKPTDLFLPSSNAFSYNLLNEDKSTFSSAADQCATPNIGEYIAYGDLESLDIINNYKSKIRHNNFVPSPIVPDSKSSHYIADGTYVDYKAAIQQNSQQVKQLHMQQNTNIQFMPVVNFGYMAESDV